MLEAAGGKKLASHDLLALPKAHLSMAGRKSVVRGSAWELLTYTNSAFWASASSQMNAAPLSKEVLNCSACLFQVTAQLSHHKDCTVRVFFSDLEVLITTFSSLKLGPSLPQLQKLPANEALQATCSGTLVPKFPARDRPQVPLTTTTTHLIISEHHITQVAELTCAHALSKTPLRSIAFAAGIHSNLYHPASHQHHQEDGLVLVITVHVIFQKLLGFSRGATYKHHFFWKLTQLPAFLRTWWPLLSHRELTPGFLIQERLS